MSNVDLGCTAIDAIAGLAQAGDAAFTLGTSVAAGVETGNAFTGSHSVCDRAGNCAVAGPIGANKIDLKAPVLSLVAPTSGAAYVLNQSVQASYSCLDQGSGVAHCNAPVSSGGYLATSTVGVKSFTLDAIDKVGNSAATMSAPYTVSYDVGLLYDSSTPTAKVLLTLVDANGVNVSAASTVVTVTAVDGAPTGGTFAFTKKPAQYSFNPKVGKGAHTLSFKATGDPLTHTVAFTT